MQSTFLSKLTNDFLNCEMKESRVFEFYCRDSSLIGPFMKKKEMEAGEEYSLRSDAKEGAVLGPAAAYGNTERSTVYLTNYLGVFTSKDGFKILLVLEYNNPPLLTNCAVVCDRQYMARAAELIDELKKYIKANNSLRNKLIYYTRGPMGFLESRVLDRSQLETEKVFLTKKTRDFVEKYIYSFVERYPLYRKHGIPASTGVLLHGAPGNGKTSVLKRAAANTKNATWIWVTSLGVSSPNDIAYFFAQAREFAPSVMVFEDAGPYIRNRKLNRSESGMTDFNESILNEFLQQTQGIWSNDGILIAMTTNLGLNEVDDAMRRPGRLDFPQEFPPPSSDLKADFIAHVLQTLPFVDEKHEATKAMDRKLKSFAQLAKVGTEAKRNALDEDSFQEGKLLVLLGHVLAAVDSLAAMFAEPEED